MLLVLALGLGEGAEVGGLRGGGVVVVAGRGGEDEGPILGLLLVVAVIVVVGGEVDAGAALEGGEEGGGHAGPDPGRPALHGGRRSRVWRRGKGSELVKPNAETGEREEPVA